MRLICVVGLLIWQLSAYAQQEYPKTLLWRVSGNGLSKPSYLYGTMHITDRRLFHFGDSLYHSIETTQGYAMEIDPDLAMEAFFKAMNQPDTSGLLKDVLSTGDLKKVAKDLEEEFGVPVEKVTKKQAWLYSNSWSKKYKKPSDMETAVDTYLYNLARRQGKWVGGIEDVEDQFNLYEELGAEFTLDPLLHKSSNRLTLEKMIRIYLDQDLNEINHFVLEMPEDERNDMLLKRNKKMAHRIDSMAHDKAMLFAVGAAHLPGTDGLIELLREKGFSVDPVFSSRKISPQDYKYTEVKRPWTTVKDSSQVFQVHMPGKSFPLDVSNTQMHMYADLGTGIVYLAAGAKVAAKVNDESALLMEFAKGMAKKGKIDSKKQIEYRGHKGYELYLNDGNIFYRGRLFLSGKTMVMILLGAEKREGLRSDDAEQFFSSLEILPEENHIIQQWFVYRNSEKSFEVELTGTPERNKDAESTFYENEQSKGWNIQCLQQSDESRGVFFMIFIKETNPGFHVINDTILFSNIKTIIGNNDSYGKYECRSITFEGYPAMTMQIPYKNESLVMRALHVNRGNRIYSLIALADTNAEEGRQAAERFISSFKISPYPQIAGAVRESPDKKFSTYIKGEFTIQVSDTADGEELTRSWISHDSATSLTFHVYKDAISPYYWAQSDSAFFESYKNLYVGGMDSVVSSKAIQNGAITGIEYVVSNKDHSNIKRMRLLPFSDTMYVLYAPIPPEIIDRPDALRFFTDFRFSTEKVEQHYLENKTSKILKDLLSEDSAIFQAASDYVSSAPFSTRDLPQLHSALLQPYRDFSTHDNCVHDQLMNAVLNLDDTSTIDFIFQNYEQLSGEKEVLKYPLLSILTRFKTQRSFDVFRLLLKEKRPLSGNPRILVYSLSDSLELSSTIVPDLLKAADDSLFIQALPELFNKLLDSGFIRLQDLSHIEKHFEKYGEQEAARLSEVGGYDWKAEGIIVLLSKLGSRFDLLEKFAQSPSLNVKLAAARELIKSNKTVSAKVLETLAEDRQYRIALHQELSGLGKVHLFPAKYSSQKALAESEVFIAASDDVEPKSISYVAERRLKDGVKTWKYFLFRVDYDDEGESYLGVAGPYETNAKGAKTDAEKTGVYFTEKFDSKRMDQQLGEYLKSLDSYLR